MPAALTSPTLVLDGPNKTINVAWTDGSNDESGFKLCRKLSSEPEFKLLGSVNTNTYADNSVTEGVTACYQIVSYNDNGESARSKTVSIAIDYTAPTVTGISPPNSSSQILADAVVRHQPIWHH